MKNILAAAGQASATKEAWKIRRQLKKHHVAQSKHTCNALERPKTTNKAIKGDPANGHMFVPTAETFLHQHYVRGTQANNKLWDIYKRQNRQKSRSLEIFYGHKNEHFPPPWRSSLARFRASYSGLGTCQSRVNRIVKQN